MAGAGSVWSPEMVERLRREYRKTNSRKLADCLGVKRQSLFAKAHKLGLSRPREGKPSNPWDLSATCLNVLALMAQGYDNPQIADRLGYSTVTITRYTYIIYGQVLESQHRNRSTQRVQAALAYLAWQQEMNSQSDMGGFVGGF